MDDRTSRRCLAVAVVLAASGVLHLGVFALDDRSWSGPISWRKPFTFGVSFGLTLATLAWVTTYLRLAPKRRAWLLGGLAVISVVEVSGITVQAWRGVPSHLNTSTPVNAAIAYTLAAGGAGLVLVLGTLALVALRGHIVGPTDVVLAVRVGFALLVVGLLSGIAMIARGTIVRRTDGAKAAYAAAGFLKDLHGVTLHAILVLPLLALALRRTQLDPTTTHRIVACASAAYVTAAVALLALNLA
jgi:hypothetical protein